MCPVELHDVLLNWSGHHPPGWSGILETPTVERKIERHKVRSRARRRVTHWAGGARVPAGRDIHYKAVPLAKLAGQVRGRITSLGTRVDVNV